MMKRYLTVIFYLFLVSPCFGAWTDKYCSVAGAGGHTGADAANAWTLAEAIAGVAAGNRVNVIAGTYTLAADAAFATAGTDTAPIWWRGYNTAIGDLDTSHALTLPRIDADTATDQVVVSGAYQIFSNINFTGVTTDAGGLINATGGFIRIFRCRIVNTAADAAARAITTDTAASDYLIANYMSANAAANVVHVAVATTVHGNYISGGLNGIYGNGTLFALFNVIDSPAADGIWADQTNIAAVGNTIYNAGDSGIDAQNYTGAMQYLADNVIVDAADKGIDQNSGADTTRTVTFSNDFYSNTTSAINGFTEQADDLTGDLNAAMLEKSESSIPFADAPGDDFDLVTGAVAKAGAFPGSFENTALFTGYLDMGAVQRQEGVATGGAAQFIAWMAYGLGGLALVSIGIRHIS